MMPVWDGNPIEISVVSNKPGPGRNGLHSVTVIFVIEKKSNNYEIAVETPRSGLFAIANVGVVRGHIRD